ncbi:MAG: hypothetical protein E6I08_07255 [Chloroflexi bacterium]|nr:MAG: hypothetical protein E6I08_07255 [Chloroflexota bacterium]
MWLACSNRCGSQLFRALFTEVEIDSEGTYQSHRIVQPGYLCLNCGAPAFDLREVPAEREAELAEDEVADAVDVLCPVCETPVSILPGEECPNCGAPLEVAPGS